MILTVGKGIRGGICHVIHQYDIPFLPERTKLERVEKLVTNLHDKTQYVNHIGNLKQALNHRLILKNV